jgi:hypothetical protein
VTVIRLFLASAVLAALAVGFLLPLPGRGVGHDVRPQAPQLASRAG